MDSCSLSGGMIDDYLTGRPMPDSDDELIRQSIERLLVEEKGYSAEDIQVDRCFEMVIDGKTEKGRAELVVSVGGRPFMTIKSAPGSLVTRHRESLAASRLACEVIVPFTVVTNGQDAEFLDTLTGKVLARGLSGIPDTRQGQEMLSAIEYQELPVHKREKEFRLYLVFADFKCGYFCR